MNKLFVFLSMLFLSLNSFGDELAGYSERDLAVIKKVQRNFLKKSYEKFHRDQGDLFLSQGKLNEAIWSYENAGTRKDLEKARELHRLLEEILGKGKETFIFRYKEAEASTRPDKVKVSYQVGEKTYEVLAISKRNSGDIFSSVASEVFASVLNDFLGAHLVPKTVFIRSSAWTGHSLQYFWEGEKEGSQLVKDNQDKGSLNPPYINDLLVFDYLTENADRHPWNRFIDGHFSLCNKRRSSIVAIDHGALWGKGLNKKYIVTDLSRLIPSYRVYLHLLHFDKENFEKRILDQKLASREQLEAFFVRRQQILDYVQNLLEKSGGDLDQVWPDYSTRFIGKPYGYDL